MSKQLHEVRDPIHIFINYNNNERRIIDSAPFQRLRHIHQLALTYLVYSGATHRRFEHSLGVMHLASKIFDTITRPQNLENAPKAIRDELSDESRMMEWRSTLRWAALCHDIGHLPFSHAAEKDLLPEGIDHETMTKRLVLDTMESVWNKFGPVKPTPEIVAKIAVGPEKTNDLPPFSPVETLLSEIITHDVFGADRMDYLLRDSLHTGVKYGSFDLHRLIDTMRILKAVSLEPNDTSEEPALGVERGGLEVAESLLMARYLVFSQVLFHPVRRIYDKHLADFLKAWLLDGVFDVKLESYLKLTDNEVLAAMLEASLDQTKPGHDHAIRIMSRNHFRKVYQLTRQDLSRVVDVLDKVREILAERYGENNVRYDDISKRTSLDPTNSDFPILTQDGRTQLASAESGVMTGLPDAVTGYVFVAPEHADDARQFLNKSLEKLIGDWQAEGDD
ncbi:MAG: HD domain-containing protein [Desulfovibrionaceae bacterium]|nr:HD domain-containing protein [Desulfovibrionaceae bacterium]